MSHRDVTQPRTMMDPHPRDPSILHRVRSAIIAGAVAVVGACGSADAPSPSDGGVRTADNPGDARVPAWRLSAEPLVEIGAGEEPGFFMVMAAVRTRDGFVVGDAGTGELRFFDPAGKRTRTVGRKGRGPGEFQHIDWIGMLPGDSLAAWDPLLRRISVYAPDGRYARDFKAQGLTGVFPSVYGAFDDGTLLVSTGMESASAPPAEGRAWRDTIALLRIGRAGEVLDTVSRVPGPARYQVTSASGTSRSNNVPFGPNTSAAVHGQTVYLATGDRYEIAVHGADGVPRMRIRKQVPARSVTAADRESYIANNIQVGGTPEQRRERHKMIEDAPFPRTMSPVGSLVADQEGNLWVREPQPPDTWDRLTRWSVFDAGGRWIAILETPGRFTVEHAGPDWVLGRKADADGTEHIRLYRLIKG